MIRFCIHLAKTNQTEESDVRMLRSRELGKNELSTVYSLNKEELLALMKFCDIRVYEETPVIACEDWELMTAFVAWRSVDVMGRKNKAKKIGKWFREAQRLFIKFARLEGM